MLKLLINKIFLMVALALLPAVLFAQEPADTLATPESGVDTLSNKIPFSFESIRLGVDVSRLLNMAFNPDGRYYELNSDISFGRYLLSVDGGTGRQSRSTDSLEYRTSGTYFRIGPDVNLIPENEDNNVFFLGARYGWSSFDERLSTIYTHNDWGSFPVHPERKTNARWFEVVTGLKARVWNNFYLGYTARLKFGLKVNDTNRFAAYEVPGFGKVGDGNTFSFSYHLFYRIPFR